MKGKRQIRESGWHTLAAGGNNSTWGVYRNLTEDSSSEGGSGARPKNMSVVWIMKIK